MTFIELLLSLLVISWPNPLLDRQIPVPPTHSMVEPIAVETIPQPKPEIAPIQPVVYTTELSLVRINQSREQAGLKKLVRASRLDVSASRKCEHMRQYDYWAHNAPNGTTWDSFITGYGSEGEILARGFNGNADRRHQAWLDSPPHRQAIMSSNFSDFGVAYCNYNDNNDLTVVHFGG